MDKKINLQYKINIITPGRVKVYDELGMSEKSDAFLDNWRDVVTNEEKLRKLCSAIFTDDFTNVDMNEIDLEQVLNGVLFFGEKGLGLLRGLQKSGKSLSAN